MVLGFLQVCGNGLFQIFCGRAFDHFRQGGSQVFLGPIDVLDLVNK
jgi:hypothetical protein